MMILVSTPGRLLQHMDQNPLFSASNLKILVLDEADRILDMGFQKEVNQILENLPQERQTLLFSATQTTTISQLARLSLRDPEYISAHANAQFSTPSTLSQFYMFCELPQKLNMLWSFIRSHLRNKIMVFLSSQKQVRFVYSAFRKLQPGTSLLHLHGKMSQTKRMDVYWNFHDREMKNNLPGAVLFCTDVAARGLDFTEVDWVIQLDCPEDVDTYIHRVGRTARMNNEGSALLVLLPTEKKMVELLESRKIPISEISANPVKQQNIGAKLQELCLQNTDLKLLAQKAMSSYVRSLHLMSKKDVFSVDDLPLDDFAHSLGLVAPPKLHMENVAKVDKNELRTRNKQEQLLKIADEAQKEGRDVIPVKVEKKPKTKVEKLLKRKNAGVLSESALKLIDDGEDEDGEKDEVLVKKTKDQTHLR
eukprot:TRINITY_DN8611_c0_g1_i1.p1 TRINITY_DN8611_c0_g1~~TRINITY_DN8611_c0_g1_i1.p1  ORF type:complete len:421 (-),score=100.59 TRINITY_DN8611_c0_g1_i1:390-1652(-)